ncbi:hypothetical protein, partial [Salmonella sp. s51944]|uniref:hypothetical protein n=1 Tax=Salmonella sp. s51944 TaxID=3159655 RepID=UPI00398099DF
SLSASPDAIPVEYQGVSIPSGNYDWRRLQDQDQDIAHLCEWVKLGIKPTNSSEMSKEMKLMLRYFLKFSITDGVLYRRAWDSKKEEYVRQLV